MSRKFTLNEIVQSALLDKIDQLEHKDPRLTNGHYLLPLLLRDRVDDPDKMIASLYKMIAELHAVNKRVTFTDTEVKYWPEASRKYKPEVFGQLTEDNNK